MGKSMVVHPDTRRQDAWLLPAQSFGHVPTWRPHYLPYGIGRRGTAGFPAIPRVVSALSTRQCSPVATSCRQAVCQEPGPQTDLASHWCLPCQQFGQRGESYGCKGVTNTIGRVRRPSGAVNASAGSGRRNLPLWLLRRCAPAPARRRGSRHRPQTLRANWWHSERPR